MELKKYDCIVIGGGPGGLVSSVYLGRFRRKVLLIDSGFSRARWIPRIRNLVGYAEGLTGPQLLKRLRKQVKLYSVDLLSGEAHIRRHSKGFTVHVGDQTFFAKSVILATGMIDIQPKLENISELRSLALLGYCPICDGYDHKNDKVALFVNNNRCLKKVKFISALCPNLILIPVGNFQLAAQIKKYANNKGIRFATTPLKSLTYSENPKKLFIYLEKIRRPLKVDFGYVALGVEFDNSAVRHLKGLKKTKDGFIQTTSHQETSIPGLYAVGDCVNALAQVSVAIGQAALASTRIHHDLFFKN